MPIVVVVGCGRPDGVAFAAKAGALGYVSEGPVVVVMVEMVGKLVAILYQARKMRAIGEENIEVAVAVVVAISPTAASFLIAVAPRSLRFSNRLYPPQHLPHE
jgi:hypothetical protein